MVTKYVPARGDLVWLEFSPQSGHEQMGRRPGLVVSGIKFNQASGLCLVCPITNTKRNNPFRIDISAHQSLTGFVMADQVKSLDFTARKMEFIESAHKDVVADVLGLLDAIVFQ